MLGSSPTIFSSVLAASSVTPSVLLMSVMRSSKGPVAPFTAASVTCLSSSGVSPKLQVKGLLLTLPLFGGFGDVILRLASESAHRRLCWQTLSWRSNITSGELG